MKKLVFVRHAKSSWEYNLPDFKRPLLQKGADDAKKVSKKIKELALKPNLLLSSPATRAFETAKIFAINAGWNVEDIKITPNLYDFAGNHVLEVIHSTDNIYNTLVIFGHNHAFTFLVNQLGSIYIDNLPTAGVAIINFIESDWSHIKKGNTEAIITPKTI